MKRIFYIVLPAILAISCGRQNPEGEVQKERRDSTEYYHTSFPATKGKNSQVQAEDSGAVSDTTDSAR